MHFCLFCSDLTVVSLMSLMSFTPHNANSKMWRMLARLGKYDKLLFFFFYLPFHSRWPCEGAEWDVDFVNVWMCLTSVFVLIRRTGDISWLIDKGSQWLHIWRVTTSIWTLMVLRHWAAIPVWTHTHTHTHTQIQTGERTVGDTLPRGRHWNSLLFPERHFNVSRSQTGSLCWRVVMFHNKAIYIYWIERLRCCEMYLPVHFVYKKPGMGIGILYKEKYITMYIAIILNAL